MKMFAKGVAVYPTYADCLNRVQKLPYAPVDHRRVVVINRLAVLIDWNTLGVYRAVIGLVIDKQKRNSELRAIPGLRILVVRGPIHPAEDVLQNRRVLLHHE